MSETPTKKKFKEREMDDYISTAEALVCDREEDHLTVHREALMERITILYIDYRLLERRMLGVGNNSPVMKQLMAAKNQLVGQMKRLEFLESLIDESYNTPLS